MKNLLNQKVGYPKKSSWNTRISLLKTGQSQEKQVEWEA
jgi:hypothetical protein